LIYHRYNSKCILENSRWILNYGDIIPFLLYILVIHVSSKQNFQLGWVVIISSPAVLQHNPIYTETCNSIRYTESNFMFSPCIFKVNHFYLPTNALNFIKIRMLKSTCINILKDSYKLRHVSDPLGSILRKYSTCFTEITCDVFCA